jgi:hypothetical protein
MERIRIVRVDNRDFRRDFRRARSSPRCRTIWVLTRKEFDRRGLVRLWERKPDDDWKQIGLVPVNLLLNEVLSKTAPEHASVAMMCA